MKYKYLHHIDLRVREFGFVIDEKMFTGTTKKETENKLTNYINKNYKNPNLKNLNSYFFDEYYWRERISD